MGGIGTTSDAVRPAQGSSSQLHPGQETHYKDWPNAGGFNASGDVRTQMELVIQGEIPAYAAGTLYRTGPGSYKIPRSNPADGVFACSHWFDGFYTVHRFEIAHGEEGTCAKARYSSYSQADGVIEHARKTGKLEGITFGQKRDICDTIYQKVKSAFEPQFVDGIRSANIGVAIQESLPAEIEQANAESGDLSNRRLLTLTTDSCATTVMDADTLEPLGLARQRNIHPALVGQFSGAHACVDPKTGHMFNYNLELGHNHVYRVFRAVPKTGEVEVLAEVSGKDIKGSYLHSMMLTENYAVLCIWSAAYAKKGLSLVWERNIVDAIASSDANSKAIWLVVDRKHGRGLVKKFTSPSFFCFHTINAWEENTANGLTDVVCELVEFQNTDIIKKFYYDNMVSDGPGVKAWAASKSKSTAASIARYRLAEVPTGIRKANSKPARAEKILSIEAGDLPQINPQFTCKKHRFVWSVLDRGRSSFLDGLGKTDTQTQTCVSWEQPRHTPGEPIFVPKPGAEDEDDGVILSVVFNGDTGASYLLCLDAQTMKEKGRVEVGVPVGFGFHGRHVPTVL